MICIKNGLVFDAVNEMPRVCDILIENGKIIKVDQNIVCPEAEIIDATGKNVYPGFVDAHSHLGCFGSAIGFEGSDGNEPTDILTPQLHIIDAINPQDITFKNAYEAGITSVATGPGSANVVGGQYMAIKTVGHRIDDMILRKTIAMKCAFGENPKRCYKDKNNYSRMATASKLRELLAKTKEYLAKKEFAAGDASKMPPLDMKLEAMIQVVKKEIPLKAHAHQADDIFTAIRIAKEFDVKLTLEHVTDGSLICEDLAKEDIMLAVGPSLTHATKFELKNKSFNTPGDLANAGCHVSIVTDAPVIPQEYLPLCAGLAIKSGMKEFDAFKAITINPARHMGVEDRIGSIEVGKDADIVIMDGSCFEVATNVVAVLVDGIQVK